jgi:Holliday junction DNA helicase RuvA
MPASRFISAIMQKDEQVLKEISGIGPKTAQRLILELQGKLEDFAYLQNINAAESETTNIDEDRQDVVDALTALGYKISEINRALREVEFKDQQNVSEKIRLVLSHLGKER